MGGEVEELWADVRKWDLLWILLLLPSSLYPCFSSNIEGRPQKNFRRSIDIKCSLWLKGNGSFPVWKLFFCCLESMQTGVKAPKSEKKMHKKGRNADSDTKWCWSRRIQFQVQVNILLIKYQVRTNESIHGPTSHVSQQSWILSWTH